MGLCRPETCRAGAEESRGGAVCNLHDRKGRLRAEILRIYETGVTAGHGNRAPEENEPRHYYANNEQQQRQQQEPCNPSLMAKGSQRGSEQGGQ